MPITADEHQTLITAIRSGDLSEDQALQAAQLVADYENSAQAAPEEASASVPEQPISEDPVEAMVQGLRGERTAYRESMAMGAYNSALEVGKAVYDFVGAVTGSEAIQGLSDRTQRAQRSAEDTAIELTQRTLTEAYGRPPTQEEVIDIAQGGAETGRLLGELGIGVGGGAATLPVKVGKAAIPLFAAEGALWGFLGGRSDKETTADRFDERIGHATVGGIMGLGFGVIPSAAVGIRNFFAKRAEEAMGRDGAEAFNRSREFNNWISFGQGTGSPLVQNIEGTAMGDVAQRKLAEQGTGAMEGIGKALGVETRPLEVAGTGGRAVMKRVLDTSQKRIRQLKGIKNDRWDSEIAAAEDLAGKDPVFTPIHTMREVNLVAEDVADTLKGNVDVSPAFKQTVAEMKAAHERGGATIKELDSWWRQFNDWKGAPGDRASAGGLLDPSNPLESKNVSKQQVWAAQLSSRLSKDIANASRDAVQSDAAKSGLRVLQSARSNYNHYAGRIKDIEDALLESIGAGAKTPAQLLRSLQGIDPDQSRRAMAQIRKMDGGEVLVDDLKQGLWDATVDAAAGGPARKGLPGQAGDVDVGALYDAFAHNTKRSVLAGVLTEEEEATAVRGITHLRDILNGQIRAKNNVVVKTVLPVGFQDALINTVSRDPGFMARLAGGAIQRGKGFEGMLFSEEGVKMLESLSPHKAFHFGKTAIGRNMATIGMVEMLKTGSAEDAINSTNTQ